MGGGLIKQGRYLVMMKDNSNQKYSEEEIEHLIQMNKYTFSVQVDRLFNLLKNIKLEKGNILLHDIIGRIVWNASATASSIKLLINNNDEYGSRSLARKLFECKLLLEYIFHESDKSKVVARILAYDFFNEGAEESKEKAVNTISTFVNLTKDDDSIVKHFEYYINRGPKHWHWFEKSFEKIVKYLETKTGNALVDEMLFANNTDFLKLLHKSAHIDLDFKRDYKYVNSEGEIEFTSPLEYSKEKLFGIIGLSRIIMKDIIELVESNLNIKITT